VQRNKLNSQSVEFAQRIDQLPKAARKAVVTVNHHSVYSSPAALNKQSVELGAAFFCATHAYVQVFPSNVPTAPLTVFAELDQLHFRVLPDLGTNTSIERNSH
jgi:hypothetical protein